MSATRTFLLELHCEEIPARFLEPLHFEFSQALFKFFDRESILPVGATVSATGFVSDPLPDFYSPRKLAWRVKGLPTSQSDQTETQVGPPQRMCVDEAGKPTIQGLKFAEKWGVDFGTVRFEQPAGKKEPCAVVTLTKRGRPTLTRRVPAPAAAR